MYRQLFLGFLCLCFAGTMAGQPPEGRRISPKQPSIAVADIQDAFGDPLPEYALARLGSNRWKLKNPPLAVEFSPDGKYLACFSQEGFLDIREMATGKVVRHWQTNKPAIRRMRFTADMKKLLLLSPRDSLAWYDLTGKDDGEFKVEKGQIPMELSGDGRWILVNSQNDTPRRMLLVDWQHPSRTVDLGSARLGDVPNALSSSFSANQRMLAFTERAVAKEDNEYSRLVVWNLHGHRRWVGPAVPDMGSRQQVSPDGKFLAVYVEKSIQIYEILLPTAEAAPQVRPLGKMSLQAEDGTLMNAIFTADSRNLITGDDNGNTVLWDVKNRKEVHRWKTSYFDVQGLSLSPDGHTLAILAGGLRLIDLRTGKDLHGEFGHRDAVRWLGFDPTGQTLVSTSLQRVVLWDLTKVTPTGVKRQVYSGSPKLSLQPTKNNFTVASFPTESRNLIVNTSEGSIWLYDPAKSTPIRQLFHNDVGGGIRCWAYAPDGKAFALSYGPNQIHYVSTAEGKPITDPIEITTQLEDMELLNDNRTLVTLAQEERFQFYDLPTGKVLEPSGVPDVSRGTDRRYVNSFSFSAHQLLIWDRFTGKIVARTERNENRSDYVNAMTPSGKFVILMSGNTLTLWETSSNQRMRLPMRSDRGAPGYLMVSPDSSMLAAGYPDGTVYLWDLRPTPPKNKPTEADRKMAWESLGGKLDTAWSAMGVLSAEPAESLALIRRKLELLPPADPKHIRQLIQQLDDRKFVVRERASRELLKLAPLAEAQLTDALKRGGPEETVTRLTKIVESLRGGVPPADRLRAIRTVELLERVATKEARELLAKIGESGDTGLAIAARDALERLRRLPGK